MDARWVYTWKLMGGPGGVKEVKARLCVKGFQDAMSAILLTIAATASLLAHRVFAATATNIRKPLTSMDISAAFLKGFSFEETAGEEKELSVKGEKRRAYFTLPNEEDYALLFSLDPDGYGLLAMYWLQQLCIEALKGGFGMKDAPRRWRRRLHAAFLRFGLIPSTFDPCVYYDYPDSVKKQFLASRRKHRSAPRKTLTREDRKGLQVKDIGKVLFDLAVNTHVDDLENLTSDPKLFLFKRFLEENFGPVKLQREIWLHVGAEYSQSKDCEKVEIGQPHYPPQLEYVKVDKLRKAAPSSKLNTVEQAQLRKAVGGVSWFTRWRMDLLSRVQLLQTKFQEGTVQDLLADVNVVTRRAKDTANLKVVYKGLPRHTPVRFILWPDAAKGDYKKGEKKPVLAYVLALAPDQEASLSGPLQLIDWLMKKATRQGTSSLLVEALAACQGYERTEKVMGVFEEMYKTPPDVEILLVRSEHGLYGIPCDLVTDAKSLYDLLVAPAQPRPSNDGLLLWILWLRERLARGSIRRCVWTTTHDMVSDGLTKVLSDQTVLEKIQQRGEFHTRFSSLCEGTLWEVDKGLPPPKSSRAKDVGPKMRSCSLER